MKLSQQLLSETRRQRNEAIIAKYARQLFQGLPMLSGFWLGTDLKAADLTVFTWPGCGAGHELFENVMRSVFELIEGNPEVEQCMRGRTFARALH